MSILSLFTKIKTLVCVFICFYLSAAGQDLEPRAYANVPKGMNVATVGYAFIKGNVITDPALPIEDFVITTQSLGLNYIHTFGLSKKLARVQVSLPVVNMDGELKLNGADVTGSRTGIGDMRVRLGINLTGSPALERKDFIQYQQKTIFGLSFVTSLPTGRYYSDKQINIGNNRWAFKPEIGVSRRFAHIYAEAYAGIWFYTNNTEYLNNKVLNQKPTTTLQAHASYYFKNQMWFGINTNWSKLGKVEVNGVPPGKLYNDWRIGGTFSAPITKKQSVRLQFHTGLLARLGLDYDSLTAAYQYVFF